MLLQMSKQSKNPTSEFYEACIVGNERKVRQMINEGMDINTKIKHSDNMSVLTIACLYRHNKIVKLLIEAGADPNVQDIYGKTALLCVCETSTIFDSVFINTIALLLRAGADTNIQDNNGDTALMRALYICPQGLIYMLLKAGANPNIQDYRGRTSLFRAINRPKILEMLLKTGNPNIQDMFGTTALIYAIMENPAVVEMLLKAGTDPNIQDVDGNTALMTAAIYSDINVVQMLVKAGANIDARNNAGNSAYNYANIDVKKYLQKVKTSISLYHTMRKKGKIPMHLVREIIDKL